MDCFHCCKPDCDNNSDVTRDERIAQDKRDRVAIDERKTNAELERLEYQREYHRKYIRSERGKEVRKMYRQSERGKEANRRYYASEKGKATQKRYKQSEKGKEKTRMANQKAVASGKNAEYCRAYYYRQKEKKIKEMMEGKVE
jgi:hypothetical protein